MDLVDVVEDVLNPMFQGLPTKYTSDKAKVMLLAIGLQESRFIYRKQVDGPAKGFWQFESGGGVRGVMTHPSTKVLCEEVCNRHNIPFYVKNVYDALEHDDVLAATLARLLLWSDYRTIPAIGNADMAWECYLRNWRPGRPHRHTWNRFYEQAVNQLQNSQIT